MKKFKISYANGYANCDVCFRHFEETEDGRKIGKKILKLSYYTQDYASNKRKGKICQTPQKHPKSRWICDRCLQDLIAEWNRTTTEREETWKGDGI